MAARHVLRGRPLEALGSAVAALPRALETVVASTPALQEGLAAVQTAASHLGAPPIGSGPPGAAATSSTMRPPSAGAAAQRVAGAAEGLLDHGARSGIKTANDIFSAMGLQLRIVARSRSSGAGNVQVHITTPAEPRAETVPQTLTPREFVGLMRQERASGRVKGLGRYVDRMIDDGRLKMLPYLPDTVQRRLYVDIARLLVTTFDRGLQQLDEASLCGHTLRVRSAPGFAGLGATHREAGGGTAGRRSSQQTAEQLRLVVDELFARQAVHMPYVPQRAQKRLCSNCLTVVFELVKDLLGGEGQELVCMGHRVAFSLEPQSRELLSKLLDDLPVRHCQLNEAALSELVDELLADKELKVAWLPSSLEREMYRGAMTALLRTTELAIARLRLNVLGREVRMSILSSAEAASSSVRRQSDEAMLYMEEEQPLRTVSYTELHERLKDLTEQRRVLRAIGELGSASFDLAADVPFLLHDATGAGSLPEDATADLPAAPGAAGSGSTGTTVAGEESTHEFQRLAATMKLARTLSLKCAVDADIAVPYSMIADLETYKYWMPWCTSGEVTPLPIDGPEAQAASTGAVAGVFHGEVGFGMETGTFLGTVGDVVKYRVTVAPPGSTAKGGDAAEEAPVVAKVLADCVNGFTYGDRLAYDWRFTRIGEKKTMVELDMFFQAKSVIYMPIWDSMQNMVLNNLMAAFVARAQKVQQEADQRGEGGGGGGGGSGETAGAE